MICKRVGEVGVDMMAPEFKMRTPVREPSIIRSHDCWGSVIVLQITDAIHVRKMFIPCGPYKQWWQNFQCLNIWTVTIISHECSKPQTLHHYFQQMQYWPQQLWLAKLIDFPFVKVECTHLHIGITQQLHEVNIFDHAPLIVTFVTHLHCS